MLVHERGPEVRLLLSPNSLSWPRTWRGCGLGSNQPTATIVPNRTNSNRGGFCS